MKPGDTVTVHDKTTQASAQVEYVAASGYVLATMPNGSLACAEPRPDGTFVAYAMYGADAYEAALARVNRSFRLTIRYTPIQEEAARVHHAA